jgi:hypothetical protein
MNDRLAKFDDMWRRLVEQTGCPVSRAKATAAAHLGVDVPPEPEMVNTAAVPGRRKDGRTIDPLEIGVREKRVEQLCDELVLKTGGEIVKFSHPGKTKQTPGIADRIYAWRRLPRNDRLISWWELKTDENMQEPGQKEFQQLVTDCGWSYYAGGYGDFKNWLVETRIVVGFEADGTTPILP